MATRSSFYAEDTVCLKQDASIIATVEVTWREVDSGAFSLGRDWIVHSGITLLDAKQCIREGHPPIGHVVIRFIEPYLGFTLVKEEELILLDRALTMGDVVKRLPTDTQSGTVLKASQTCSIEPIYEDLPFTGSEPWPYKAEANRLCVNAEELTPIDFETGDRIIFRDWIGEVVDTTEEVTIRLGNGSVVKVDDPERLLIPDHTRIKHEHKWQQDLPTILRNSRKSREQNTSQGKKHMTPATEFWPGLKVTTSKANLRLGVWKIGRYNPSVTPEGVVVDVRVTSLQVDWIATKLFDSSRPSLAQPDDVIEWPALDEVRIYNAKNLTSSNGLSSNDLGSRVMSDIGAGDKIRFRDVPGAAVKYSADAPNTSETGIFRRIPRSITDGFDMNVFLVKQSNTTVRIQWQDGTITLELAVNLLPYLNIDDHDVWPGEIVSVKSEEVERDETLIELKKIGVVQTVDSEERTAQVRWFIDPSVSVYKHSTSVLFSGAKVGPISDQESSVPLYDVTAYPALSKRRGDLVILAPGLNVQCSETTTDSTVPSINGTATDSSNPSGAEASPDPQNILSSTEVRWFGEVVNLTLDGELIVRLGALDQVEDIRMPIQRVNVIIGGDDPDDFGSENETFSDSDESMDDDSDVWGSIMDEEEAIIEETLYEGGERLDDGDDDAWMTDGSDSGDRSLRSFSDQDNEEPPKKTEDEELPELVAPTSNIDAYWVPHETHTTTEKSQEIINGPDISEHDRVQPSLGSKFSLVADQNMPPAFEILDGAPSSHHYLPWPIAFDSALLRRIRQEHAILSTSLPEGIWVRTWSDRLDLVQVLILGPQGTPYALAPFLFDFHFKQDFPQSPPSTYFHSWTNGVGRINPNLYEDGNVCLSVLGTWHGNNEAEGWNRQKSSLLQVLVSLLGLVLVEQPYYNEAGFDTLVRAEESLVPARIYAEKALCLSKGFIAHALTQGCGALTDVVEWLYRSAQGPKLIVNVVDEMHELLARRKEIKPGNEVAEESSGKKALSTGAEALLRRYLPALEGVAKDVATS